MMEQGGGVNVEGGDGAGVDGGEWMEQGGDVDGDDEGKGAWNGDVGWKVTRDGG